MKKMRRTIITKISGYFVKMDMPDPRTDWPGMLAEIGILSCIILLGIGIFFGAVL